MSVVLGLHRIIVVAVAVSAALIPGVARSQTVLTENSRDGICMYCADELRRNTTSRNYTLFRNRSDFDSLSTMVYSPSVMSISTSTFTKRQSRWVPLPLPDVINRRIEYSRQKSTI